MITASALLEKWTQIDVELIAEVSVANTKEEMLDLNLEQMMEGKTKEGTDISPSYLEDPYFKSRESAQRYSDWKDKITPNPKRKKGVPNYYINGQYHSSIEIEVNGESIDFSSSFSGAADIAQKTGGKLFGLNAEKRVPYIDNYLRKEFMYNLRRTLKQ